MRWYSIKKYTPPACVELFIRAVFTDKKEIPIYCRYFVGMIEDFREIHELSSWEMANGEKLMDIDLSDYVVTHFSIIDAIEIEE